jgi:hypothetical protein
MSSRSILVGLASVLLFGLASLAGVWYLTRERPFPEWPSSPPAPQAQSAPSYASSPPAPLPAASPSRGDPPASPQPVAAAAPRPIPRPAPGPPRPPVRLTPLFHANARLEVGKTAALEFRAQQEGSGAAATRERISVSALMVGERIEKPLPVREMGGGVYRAEFTPREPGQFVVAASSRGLLASTVSVVVPDEEARGPSAPGAGVAQGARVAAGRGRR